jgi:hypothetical protein
MRWFATETQITGTPDEIREWVRAIADRLADTTGRQITPWSANDDDRLGPRLEVVPAGTRVGPAAEHRECLAVSYNVEGGCVAAVIVLRVEHASTSEG